MSLRYYKRINALACNLHCADAFKSDRQHGLNYGAFRFADGRFALNWEQASREAKFCAYCGSKEGRV